MNRCAWLAVVAVVAMVAVTASDEARAEVTTRKVTWSLDGVAFEGALVFDPARLASRGGKLPGVLVVHQWMGPTAYEEMRATMLAELGYAAFIADAYGRDVRPKDRAEAGKAAGHLRGGDRALLRQRLAASLAQLRAQPEVDGAKLAAIGYCFGGTGVLELARSGADLRGVVSFHGGLDSPSPADGKHIRAKIMVLNGAADPSLKKADVEAFFAELDAAKVDWQRVDYAGAVHAFTQKQAGDDPSKGAAYDERADRRSWAAMVAFLAEVLG